MNDYKKMAFNALSALACTLAPLAASAQSSVQVYGVVDMAVSNTAARAQARVRC
jgi:predicted porin